jgi:hypothetical protein
MIQENNKNNMEQKKEKKTIKKKIDSKKDIEAYRFNDLEGKFLHIKVGTQDSPATEIQIKDVEKQIVSLFQKNNVNCLTFVTHHAVDMAII